MSTIDWDKVETAISSFSKGIPINVSKSDREQAQSNMIRSIRNTFDINKWFIEVNQSIKTPKSKAFSHLIRAFYKIEGELAYWINFIVFYLVRLGHHDLWCPFNQKYVRSYTEVTEVSLRIKTRFLEDHGFDFIEDFAFRDIRNAIAHQEYLIRDNGEIEIYRNQKIKKILTVEDLNQISSNISRLIGTTVKIWAETSGLDMNQVMMSFQGLTFEEILEKATQPLFEEE